MIRGRLPIGFMPFCDLCDTAPNMSFATREDAEEWAAKQGWHIHSGGKQHICDDCAERSKAEWAEELGYETAAL